MSLSRAKSLTLSALTTWVACTMSPMPADEPGALDPEEAMQGTISDVEEPGDEGRLVLPPGARVAYAGSFDWEDAIREDGSYNFVNSLGYQFRIDALYLVTSSVQLRACEEEQESSPSSSWLPRWGVAVAYADHVVEDDPSLAWVGKVEDALAEEIMPLAVGVVGGGTYCQAFARSAQFKEPGGAQVEHTLVVAGAYTFGGNVSDENWVEFDASVTLTEGLLKELSLDPSPTWRSSEDDIDAGVLLVRYPVRAFQFIDPRRLLPVELAWELLGNLLHTSSVTFYKPTPQHDPNQ